MVRYHRFLMSDVWLPQKYSKEEIGSVQNSERLKRESGTEHLLSSATTQNVQIHTFTKHLAINICKDLYKNKCEQFVVHSSLFRLIHELRAFS